jgi:hypothetical protein
MIVIFTNLNDCKEYAKKLLEKTDYATLSDVQPLITNYNDIITYRENIRMIYLKPGYQCSFPEEPQPIWNNS